MGEGKSPFLCAWIFPFGLVLVTGLTFGITTMMIDALRIWTLDNAHDLSIVLASREF